MPRPMKASMAIRTAFRNKIPINAMGPPPFFQYRTNPAAEKAAARFFRVAAFCVYSSGWEVLWEVLSDADPEAGAEEAGTESEAGCEADAEPDAAPEVEPEAALPEAELALSGGGGSLSSCSKLPGAKVKRWTESSSWLETSSVPRSVELRYSPLSFFSSRAATLSL